MEPLYIKNGIKISPNPVNSHFAVQIQSDKNISASIQIIDTNGKRVFEEAITLFTGDNKYLNNISELQAGVYLVNIITSENNWNTKIMKL